MGKEGQRSGFALSRRERVRVEMPKPAAATDCSPAESLRAAVISSSDNWILAGILHIWPDSQWLDKTSVPFLPQSPALQIGHCPDACSSFYAICQALDALSGMNPAQFSSLPASACTLDTAGTMSPDRITKNTYDVLGRVTKTVGGFGVMNGGAGNIEIELGYTANGQISWRKDGNGNKTGYAYDSHDRNNYIYYPHKTSIGNHNRGGSVCLHSDWQ